MAVVGRVLLLLDVLLDLIVVIADEEAPLSPVEATTRSRGPRLVDTIERLLPFALGLEDALLVPTPVNNLEPDLYREGGQAVEPGERRLRAFFPPAQTPVQPFSFCERFAAAH